jgi:hypothetical protein
MIVRPYLCLIHFPRVQITAPQSTVHSWFQNPPVVLSLTEVGGVRNCLSASSRSGRFMKERVDQWSTMDSGPPPAVLPLTEGGGGPELFISFEQIWTALNRALRSTVHNGFRTPPSVLPLTEGGGSGIKN